MNSSNTSTQDGRKFRIGLFALLAVVVLAGAAYLWGNRLNADTLQVDTQSSSETSASRYGSSLGISAVRAADASASLAPSASSASRYGRSLGISAVRAADASASHGSSLRGVAGVRAVDQTANTSSSLRVGGGTKGLSNLELRRAESQTQK
jgi:hypothetical protein